MNIFGGDINVLARAMIKDFPTDAADRAAMRSKAFLVLGYAVNSKTWSDVSEEIERIHAARRRRPRIVSVRKRGSL